MNRKSVRKASHWDALGNPILGFYEMREYYWKCDRSCLILQKYLPHQYVVIPKVVIRFDFKDPKEWFVSKIYPGGESDSIRYVGNRALDWARKVYSGKVPGWKVEKGPVMATLTKEGYLEALSVLRA